MKSRHATMASRRRGFTLMEMTIVLAVAGLVAAGVWTAASAAWRNVKINRTIDQLRIIVENTRARYNAASVLPAEDYTAFTQTLARADVFPAEMKLSPNVAPAACAACYFINPWDDGDAGALCGGGAVCASATDAFGGAAAGYSIMIVMRNIPGDACIEIATRISGIWDDVGLIAIGVDGDDDAVPGAIATTPQSPTVYAGGCDPANPNHLYFAFRLQGG